MPVHTTPQIGLAYQECYPRILAYVQKKIACPQTAEDLTQDVFCKMLDFCALGHTIDNPPAWLYRAARNLAIDYYRHEGRIQLCEFVYEARASGDIEEQAVQDADTAERLAIVQKNAGVLTPNQRETIEWMFLREYTDHETASIVGISANAVQSRKNCGLNAIKRAIHETLA